MKKYWLYYLDYENADMLTRQQIRHDFAVGKRGAKAFEQFARERLTDAAAFVRYSDVKEPQ